MWINGIFYDMSAAPVWGADIQVLVGGKDRTGVMLPYLIDVSVTDKAGKSSDSCSLTFDDTDDVISLDMEGAEIEVVMNKTSVFEGVVETARSTGSRGGGRLVPVTAKSFDTRGPAKQPLAFHRDETTLGGFLSDAAKKAGFTMEVDPAFAPIARDYFSAEYESFLDLGEKFARELDGTFKLRGKKAVLVKRGATSLATAYGVVGPGGNVISWDIAPFTGRPQFQKAEARWFDRKKAEFKTETVDLDVGGDASNIIRLPMGDEDQAKARAGARKGEAKRGKGGGTIVTDLMVEAQAEAIFMLSGAKRDADGPWRIDGVTHHANRSGGAITTHDVKEPGAGED